MQITPFRLAIAFALATAATVACTSDDAHNAPAAGADSGATTPAPTATATATQPGPLVVVAPTITPNGGNFSYAPQVSISAPAGAIHYTTDDSTPTETSPLYTAPFPIVDPGGTIRAIAVLDGRSSSVAVAKFTIASHTGVIPPKIRPDNGQYDGGVDVELSYPEPSYTLCYTVDSTPPACKSGVCTAPTISYDGGTIALRGDAGAEVNVKVVACAPDESNSEISTASYTF